MGLREEGKRGARRIPGCVPEQGGVGGWTFLGGSAPGGASTDCDPVAALQVYGILALQLTLTAVVATVIVSVPAAHNFLLASPGVWIGLLVLCLLSKSRPRCAGPSVVGARVWPAPRGWSALACPRCGTLLWSLTALLRDASCTAAMIPLYMFRHSHPTNLILLGVWVSGPGAQVAGCWTAAGQSLLLLANVRAGHPRHMEFMCACCAPRPHCRPA